MSTTTTKRYEGDSGLIRPEPAPLPDNACNERPPPKTGREVLASIPEHLKHPVLARNTGGPNGSGRNGGGRTKEDNRALKYHIPKEFLDALPAEERRALIAQRNRAQAAIEGRQQRRGGTRAQARQELIQQGERAYVQQRDFPANVAVEEAAPADGQQDDPAAPDPPGPGNDGDDQPPNEPDDPLREVRINDIYLQLTSDNSNLTYYHRTHERSLRAHAPTSMRILELTFLIFILATAGLWAFCSYHGGRPGDYLVRPRVNRTSIYLDEIFNRTVPYFAACSFSEEQLQQRWLNEVNFAIAHFDPFKGGLDCDGNTKSLPCGWKDKAIKMFAPVKSKTSYTVKRWDWDIEEGILKESTERVSIGNHLVCFEEVEVFSFLHYWQLYFADMLLENFTAFPIFFAVLNLLTLLVRVKRYEEWVRVKGQVEYHDRDVRPFELQFKDIKESAIPSRAWVRVFFRYKFVVSNHDLRTAALTVDAILTWMFERSWRVWTRHFFWRFGLRRVLLRLLGWWVVTSIFPFAMELKWLLTASSIVLPDLWVVTISCIYAAYTKWNYGQARWQPVFGPWAAYVANTAKKTTYNKWIHLEYDEAVLRNAVWRKNALFSCSREAVEMRIMDVVGTMNEVNRHKDWESRMRMMQAGTMQVALSVYDNHRFRCRHLGFTIAGVSQ